MTSKIHAMRLLGLLHVAIGLLPLVTACGEGPAATSGLADNDATAIIEATYAEQLYFLVQADPSSPGSLDKFNLLIAGPTNVVAVKYCERVAPAACTPTASVPAAAVTVSATRAYFRTAATLAPQHNDSFTALGLDAAGNVVAQSNVTFADATAGAVALPQAQDVPLKAADGSASSLSKVFKGKLLMIDLSGATCGGCFQLARMIAADTELQSAFESGKCSHVTIVDDLSGWLSRFPASGSTGKHSYGSSLGLHGVAKAFNVNLRYTPTVIVIDQTGKVVNSPGSSIPSSFREQCR
jgi:hypothetical protein